MSASPTAPPVEAFVYVDTAIGGGHQRNNVVQIGDYDPPTGAVDCFATYLRYTDDLANYVSTHRNRKGKPSVEGYEGIAFAPFLPLDFDSADDLQSALTDARQFLRRIGARHDVPPEACRVFFSGCKGFSIEIPASLFGGFAPGDDLPARLKILAGDLTEGLSTLDQRMYQHIRLWRTPNTVNSHSGLFKIPLTPQELLTLTVDEIRGLAASARTIDRIPDDEWEARPELSALWKETATRARRHYTNGRTESASTAKSTRHLTGVQIDRVISLVAPHWSLGQKHDMGVCLSGYLGKQGVSEDQALAITEQLASTDDRPSDRIQAVQDTYERLRTGQETLGFYGLRELLPADVLHKLDGIIGCAETEVIIDRQPYRKAVEDEPGSVHGDSGPRNDEERDQSATDAADASHSPGSDAATNERLAIDAGDQNLERSSALAWSALQIANKPPRLFRFGGAPVRVEGAEDDATPIAQTLNEDRLGHELARAAIWFKETEKAGVKAAAPPTRMIRDMLAAPTYPLPPLTSIVQVPTFAPDGSLQVEPGYHAAGQTFYAPSPGFTVPPVAAQPDSNDIERATAIVLDEMLGEFPFINAAERANTVALFLDPYVRNLIDGPTPLRLIEAPTPGSGKGLLADAVLRPAIGRRVNAMPAANDDDEWRKRITAQLVQSPGAILIDNITKGLDSGALSSALTALWWTDRRLGAHEMVRVPVRCVWIATANNPTMSTELARRTVRIRLDPKLDRPWRRSGFRHADLRTWVDDHRCEIVWAALTLVQAWIVAGRPLGSIKLGSFERWAAVLGGILGNVGIDGFLGNLETFYETADLEGAIWRQFVGLWAESYGEAEVGVANLFALALAVEGFDFGKGSDRAQKTTFGVALNKQRDRVIGEYRIVFTRLVQRAKQWRLIRARSGDNPFGAFYEDHGAGDQADQ